MTKFMTLFLFLLSFNALAQKENYVKLEAKSLKLDDEHLIVLNFKNDKKWHTYWKNPGDAGLPISTEFKVGSTELQPTHLEWPTPKKYIEQGNILAYGYEGQYQLFFKLNLKQLEQVKNKTLNIYSKWLVCKDICIPGSKKFELKLDKNGEGKTSEFKLSENDIRKAYHKLPKLELTPAGLEITLVKSNEENRLAIHYSFSGVEINEIDAHANLLTPFPTTPLDFKHEALYYDSSLKTLYGRMYADWDGMYQEPVMELPSDGIFKNPLNINFLISPVHAQRTQVISIDFESFALSGDESFDRVVANFKKVSDLKISAKQSGTSSTSFLLYLVFAFLGGLILNLMPCVLPVISLKLFGLIAHRGEEKSTILKHNISYTMGIIVSFWVLALTILFLKSSGEQIGWGFQLQSPIFVFIMLILLLVMAMNMLGLFEFKTPGGKVLGNLKVEDNYSGAFVSGVLATILSTPCSAPFLGTALTFAFTTSNLNIFIIFTFVGLGLAAPFILTGIFPKLVNFLPKPGAWMEKLKYILGFSLLLTFVWLYDVLSSLIDISNSAITINIFFASLFFAFFFYNKISKKIVWNIIIFLIPLLLLLPIAKQKMLKTYYGDKKVSSSTVGLKWNPWSQEKLNNYAQKKNWVFVDFTASWCLTCKVNKKLVLNTDDFSELVQDKKIELLVGDWSKRDEKITQFLRSYDVVGVPAYFLQSPEGKIIHLGETISISKIEEAIKKN